MKWHRISYGDDVYANEAGKVIGRVRTTYRSYTAFYLGESLGEYISLETAQKAVEKAAT